MALIRCSECGRQISHRAECCPQCGAPNGPSRSKRQTGLSPAPRSGCFANLVKWFLGGFGLLVFLGLLSPKDPQRLPEPMPQPQTPQPPPPPKVVIKAPPTLTEVPPQETPRNYTAAFEHLNERLKTIDPDGLLFKSTNLNTQIDEVTFTVFDEFHVLPYQQRLQISQNLWKFWAVDLGTNRARIKVVDLNGNEVGGSRFFLT